MGQVAGMLHVAGAVHGISERVSSMSGRWGWVGVDGAGREIIRCLFLFPREAGSFGGGEAGVRMIRFAASSLYLWGEGLGGRPRHESDELADCYRIQLTRWEVAGRRVAGLWGVGRTHRRTDNGVKKALWLLRWRVPEWVKAWLICWTLAGAHGDILFCCCFC